MNAKRLAEVLRAVAKRLDPPRSYADEVESLRRELEAEARAEFGLRHLPDPASPGDVWPRESTVTPFTRKRRGVR